MVEIFEKMKLKVVTYKNPFGNFRKFGFWKSCLKIRKNFRWLNSKTFFEKFVFEIRFFKKVYKLPYLVWRFWTNDRNLWRNEAENRGSHDSLKLFQKPDSRDHRDFSNYCKSKTRDPQEHVWKILFQSQNH